MIFLVMIMNYPMIRWSKRRGLLKPINSIDWQLFFGLLTTWGAWCILSSALSETEEEFWDHILPCNLLMLAAYLTFFLVQYILQRNHGEIDTARFTGLMSFYGIAPLFNVLMNLFISPSEEFKMCSALTMFSYHTLFFAQGIFVYTWRKYLHADLDHMR